MFVIIIWNLNYNEKELRNVGEFQSLMIPQSCKFLLLILESVYLFKMGDGTFPEREEFGKVLQKETCRNFLDLRAIQRSCIRGHKFWEWPCTRDVTLNNVEINFVIFYRHNNWPNKIPIHTSMHSLFVKCFDTFVNGNYFVYVKNIYVQSDFFK